VRRADFGRSRERNQTAGIDPTSLQHGICVGLIELELAERPKGTLTHHEVLSRRINIAEAALRRIGIEKCTAARSLKCKGRHALCHLGNVTGRGSHFSCMAGRGTDPAAACSHAPDMTVIASARADASSSSAFPSAN